MRNSPAARARDSTPMRGQRDNPYNSAREIMMSLATSYLGLELKNPLVASASPLNSKLDNIRRLEDAGVAAIVLPSLFQEQIEADAEARLSFVGAYAVRPDRYLDLVRRAREAVSIPIIASLNGSSRAGWIDHAWLMEQAGATALELNMYHIPVDPLESGIDVEARYLEIIRAVR